MKTRNALHASGNTGRKEEQRAHRRRRRDTWVMGFNVALAIFARHQMVELTVKPSYMVNFHMVFGDPKPETCQ